MLVKNLLVSLFFVPVLALADANDGEFLGYKILSVIEVEDSSHPNFLDVESVNQDFDFVRLELTSLSYMVIRISGRKKINTYSEAIRAMDRYKTILGTKYPSWESTCRPEPLSLATTNFSRAQMAPLKLANDGKSFDFSGWKLPTEGWPFESGGSYTELEPERCVFAGGTPGYSLSLSIQGVYSSAPKFGSPVGPSFSSLKSRDKRFDLLLSLEPGSQVLGRLQPSIDHEKEIAAIQAVSRRERNIKEASEAAAQRREQREKDLIEEADLEGL